MEGGNEGKIECGRKRKNVKRKREGNRRGKGERKVRGKEERTYLCSSLSICLAREILFLMEDI